MIFTTVDDGNIRYGLGRLRDSGRPQLDDYRSEGRSFESLGEFCRVKLKLGKKALEALINSGSMDSFGLESCATNEIRSELHRELEAIKSAEQIDRDAKAGIVDLFGGIESGTDLFGKSCSSYFSNRNTRERKRISWIIFKRSSHGRFRGNCSCALGP